MESKIMVEKRDGTLEPLLPEKYHQHLEHAVEGITGVSMSDIEMRASIQIVNGSKSSDIQKAFINAAVDGIPTNPKLDKVAARLLNQDIRKEVYGGYTPRPLLETIKINGASGA